MDKPVARIRSGSEYMDLYADGRIGRPAVTAVAANYGHPSGKWHCAGAVLLNNFGHAVRRYSLVEVLAGGLQWRYKNGKQRLHLCDIDHGTPRMWGSPDHEVYPLS